jgi:alpha-glucosidase
MQWDTGVHAGFTTGGTPWLPIPPSAATYNVQVESQDQDSIYNTYKRLLAMRRSEPALRDGSYEAIDEGNEHVFSYVRKSADEKVVIALNMSAQPRTVDLKAAGVKGDVLYRSPLGKRGLAAETASLERVELEPFGFVVLKVLP